MDESIKAYRVSLKTKLKTMKSKNPKDYWKLINAGKKKGSSSKISIDDLYNFFKDLNAGDINDNNDEQPDIDVPNIIINEVINSRKYQ